MIHPEILTNAGNDISILLRVENHRFVYLVDCGAAERVDIHDLKRVGAVFVSHTHFDHWVQFDAVFRHFIGTGRVLRVFGPPGMIRHVQARLQSYLWNLSGEGDFTILVSEIEGEQVQRRSRLNAPHWEEEMDLSEMPKGAIFEDQDLRVDAITLDHGTPSVAYRFSTPPAAQFDATNSPYPPGPWVARLKESFLSDQTEGSLLVGKEEIPIKTLLPLLTSLPAYRLGIILDHAASGLNHDQIARFFHRHDRVLIESYFAAADRERALKRHHSYTTASAKILREAKVVKAEPIHFSRKYTSVEVEAMREEFRVAFLGE